MYNKAFLIGNLTRDPELRYTSSGIPVARFAIAINRFGKKGGGENSGSQEVDFINIVAWRRLAEICAEFLKKGMPVAIEGRLQVREFTGRDGEKKTMTEVVADNMQMLGRKLPVASQEPRISDVEGLNDNELAKDEGEIPF